MDKNYKRTCLMCGHSFVTHTISRGLYPSVTKAGETSVARSSFINAIDDKGHFCTQHCAARFGVLAADAGYAVKKRLS